MADKKEEAAPADSRDALEVLEAEAKEWDKVRFSLASPFDPIS